MSVLGDASVDDSGIYRVIGPEALYSSYFSITTLCTVVCLLVCTVCTVLKRRVLEYSVKEPAILHSAKDL